MSLSTLEGANVTKARVQIGAWGCWWADVDLSEPIELAVGRKVSLVLAGTTCACAVVSGGAFEGRAAYHLVGGAGGWGKRLPKKAYRDSGGVKISSVLGDAASAAGETLAGVPTARIGEHFARPANDLASTPLHELAPRAWYVGFDGVTRFGSRPAVAYTGDGARVRVDKQAGVYELAVSSIAQLLPGATIDGSEPATDVELRLTPDRLTAIVYTGRRSSRKLDAMAATIAALFPGLRFAGSWEYRVVSQLGDRLDLQAVRTAAGMPDLSGVPIRPGVAGTRGSVQLGELVLVCFADNDPSRPQVFAHDAPDAPGWMPLTIELGGPLALGVARLTDPVQAGPFAGVVTGGSARVKASL